jgi:tetratricopeptide (TPR) repeat protein
VRSLVAQKRACQRCFRRGSARQGLDLGQGHARPAAAHVVRGQAGAQSSRSVGAKSLGTAHAARAYALAFAASGLAVEPGREREVAARVGKSAVKHQLLAALDHWARQAIQGKQDELWGRLLAVARLADPGPWSDQVRDPALWKKRVAFVPLAVQAQKDPRRFRQLTPQILVLIGSLLPDQKAAETWLRKAQALHPTDDRLNFGLAYTLMRAKGHEREAIGFYRAALAVRPRSPVVYNNLGVILCDLTELAGGIEAFQMALAIDPHYFAAWHNLGDAFQTSKVLPGAGAAYKKAVAIDKSRAAIWHNLGAALHYAAAVRRGHRTGPVAADATRERARPDAALGRGRALRPDQRRPVPAPRPAGPAPTRRLAVDGTRRALLRLLPPWCGRMTSPNARPLGQVKFYPFPSFCPGPVRPVFSASPVCAFAPALLPPWSAHRLQWSQCPQRSSGNPSPPK